MKYRIRADLIFTNRADAVAVGKGLKNQLTKVVNLLEDKSFIELQECNHDANPPQPCKTLYRVVKE